MKNVPWMTFINPNRFGIVHRTGCFLVVREQVDTHTLHFIQRERLLAIITILQPGGGGCNCSVCLVGYISIKIITNISKSIFNMELYFFRYKQNNREPQISVQF